MACRVLRVLAVAAVAEAGIDHPAGDLHPAAEMMPRSRRIVAGEDGLAADKGVALDHRAVDGGGGFAIQDGGVAEVDMAVDHRHIEQPALPPVEHARNAGDLRRLAVGEVDAHQPAAAQGDKHRVMVEELHPPRVRHGRADALDAHRGGGGDQRQGGYEKGRTEQRGPDEVVDNHGCWSLCKRTGTLILG